MYYICRRALKKFEKPRRHCAYETKGGKRPNRNEHNWREWKANCLFVCYFYAAFCDMNTEDYPWLNNYAPYIILVARIIFSDFFLFVLFLFISLDVFAVPLVSIALLLLKKKNRIYDDFWFIWFLIFLHFLYVLIVVFWICLHIFFYNRCTHRTHHYVHDEFQLVWCEECRYTRK